MRNATFRLAAGVALSIALAAGTSFAWSKNNSNPASAPSPAATPSPTPTAGSGSQLQPNQTLGFANGGSDTFTYTENFDCVDEPTFDLNFNEIPAESDPSEMQTPICQIGTPSTIDPTGAPVAQTDKLYVLVPFFSVDKDTDPDDALPCPSNPAKGEVCGTALGKFLIANFGAIPEGFKTNPSVSVQCPNPTDPSGSCTMHGDLIDLYPALVALGKLPPASSGNPAMNVLVPLPNHSHVINMDVNQPKPVWWQIIVDNVTDPDAWPSANGGSGITSVAALRTAQSAGDAMKDVPTNFFLFFGTQQMSNMNMQSSGANK